MPHTRQYRYGGALTALILAVVTRWFLDPILGDQAPTVTMYPAVALAVLLGGIQLAVPVALVGFVVCAYLFMPPRGMLDLGSARMLVGLVAYLSICGLIIALGDARRRLQQRLDAAGHAEPQPLFTTTGVRGPRALRDPVLLAFVFCLAVLVIGGLAGYQSTRRLVRTERLVESTNQNIADLEALLSTVKDAETGQRGYLLTGNEAYIQPYNVAVTRLPRQLDRLREGLALDPDQLGRLGDLERTIVDKMEELSATIEQRRAGRQSTALGQVRSNEGQELMESIRRRVAEMQEDERRYLVEGGRASDESLRITMLAILLTATIGVLLLITLFHTARRVLRDRQRWGETLAEERERFRVTLASIGDGVITTDVEGLITYLNPVAEQLSGWTTEAARGRRLSDVFQIVNETTREPVTNPADRALSEGLIIGLANHTVLIGRDGREVPIDDSAAPIRDEQGRVTGCVLTFRDVSDRRLSEMENLRRVDAASFLVSIVESSEDAIIGVSLNGIIQTWNDAAERLYLYPTGQAVGQPITMLIPNDRADEEDRIIARIIAGERISHFDTVRCDRNGRQIPVSLTISPVRDDTGEIVGTSKIVRDITEAKEAERRIYSLMSELREADARKDEFLAILAHELRGPLAPIRHRLEILKLAGNNPQLRQESIDKVDQQLVQLVRLVDDLLDVSRITRNKLDLRRETLDLGDVVHQAVELARPIAEAQGHQLVVSVPTHPMQIEADPIRLAQIFGNLLQNACKYSDYGGTITVSMERQGSDARIAIRDSGIGIEPELLPRIFDLFTQVRAKSERAQGGLGIGLTLVRQLVAIHGGSIEAHSEGLGKGSEFIVRLPLAFSRTGVAVVAPVGVLPGAPARRVLVVDDNTETAESLVVLLNLLGHQTEMANDGQAALVAAERFAPDVMLLDIGLPRLNGYEVCERIRQAPWGKGIVIAAVSGWGQEADRRKSAEAGFDLHMVKPLEYSLLLRILAEPKAQG